MMDIKQIEAEVVYCQNIADRDRTIIRLINENQELRAEIKQLNEKIVQSEKDATKDEGR